VKKSLLFAPKFSYSFYTFYKKEQGRSQEAKGADQGCHPKKEVGIGSIRSQHKA